MTDRARKWIAGGSLLLFAAVLIALVLWIGAPMTAFFSDPAAFRDWVASRGFSGRLIFVGLCLLQVVVAVIPGEPLEIAAGYAFGAVEGTLLCLFAMTLGSLIVFLLVRRFGKKAVEVFFSPEKLRSLSFLQDKRRMTLWIAILFLIPGTPKDLLCYFVGLTDIKWTHWLLIGSLCRLPSILTSTIGGDALGLQNGKAAILAFSVALALLLGGILLYRHLSKPKTP